MFVSKSQKQQKVHLSTRKMWCQLEGEDFIDRNGHLSPFSKPERVFAWLLLRWPFSPTIHKITLAWEAKPSLPEQYWELSERVWFHSLARAPAPFIFCLSGTPWSSWKSVGPALVTPQHIVVLEIVSAGEELERLAGGRCVHGLLWVTGHLYGLISKFISSQVCELQVHLSILFFDTSYLPDVTKWMYV